MSESNTSKKPPRTGFLSFVVSTIKMAIAILIALVILAVITSAISAAIYFSQQKKQKPYAEPRSWVDETVDVFEDTTFHLITKWEDGSLYYQFAILGYPSVIKKHYEEGDVSNYSISIIFYDSDGFLVDDHEIPLNEFSRHEGQDGISGLSSNSKTYMSFNNYKKIAMWTIQWKL